MTAGNTGAWDDGARGYGSDGGYPAQGPQGYGPRDGGYDDGYGDQYGQQTQGGYDGSLSYQDDGYGQPAGYEQQPPQGYGTGGYPAAPNGYQSGGYPASPANSYPAPAGGSGAYPVHDAGNDWYSGQPSAASGASFADTGTYSLNGRAIDEYGTGPRPMPGSARGQQTGPRPVTGRLALPAAQSRTPAVNETRQQPVAQTRQQQRLDPSASGQGRSPSGAYPTRNPSGAYPTRNPSGAYPTRNPSGAYPTSSPSGANKVQKPGSGAYPTVGARDEFGSVGNGGGWERSGPADAFEGNRNPRPRPAIESRKNRIGGGGKRMLLAALAVVVVGIIAAAAYVFVLKPKPAASNQQIAGGTMATPSMGQSAAANQACSAALIAKLGQYCHIENAADDPKALTVAELYPAAFSNPQDKMSYALVADKIDTTCANPVIDVNSPLLANALKAGHCTQVVRGSYVTTGESMTSNADIMGTIAVINLGTITEAHNAGKVVGDNDFIAPLTATTVPASKLGNGTGLIEAAFKGHYLIVTWAQYVNGTDPTTAALDKPLNQFSQDLLNETANNALDTRMVTGQPGTAAA